jgi:hypothetical protein
MTEKKMSAAEDDAAFEVEYGCNPETLYRSIGRFVFNFSRFEDVLRWRVFACLQLNARQGGFVTPAIDFAFLCRLGKVVFQERYRDEPKKLDELSYVLNTALRINEDRVRVAHGSWYLNPPAGFTVHTSRNSLEEGTFFYQPGELDRLADQLFALRHRLWDLANDLGEIFGPG